MILDRRTWLVILSHAPAHEDPVLEAALKSPVRYIGCMGSRRTQELRVGRLRDKGFSEEDIARTVAAPAEMPIGVVTAFFGAPFFLLVLRTIRGPT